MRNPWHPGPAELCSETPRTVQGSRRRLPQEPLLPGSKGQLALVLKAHFSTTHCRSLSLLPSRRGPLKMGHSRLWGPLCDDDGRVSVPRESARRHWRGRVRRCARLTSTLFRKGVWGESWEIVKAADPGTGAIACQGRCSLKHDAFRIRRLGVGGCCSILWGRQSQGGFKPLVVVETRAKQKTKSYCPITMYR